MEGFGGTIMNLILDPTSIPVFIKVFLFVNDDESK